VTDREAFLCAVASGPFLPSDAIIVISGDGTTRLEVAIGCLRQRAAHHVVLSGGVDNPPHSLGPDDATAYMIQKGLAPDRIIVEGDSQNTREQAVNCVKLIREHEWERVLLCVSPYHMPRAMLTFIQALREDDAHERCHILPIAASQTSWWAKPDGLDATRMELLADEFDKIERYGPHVATWAEGLEYLRFWEGHDDV